MVPIEASGFHGARSFIAGTNPRSAARARAIGIATKTPPRLMAKTTDCWMERARKAAASSSPACVRLQYSILAPCTDHDRAHTPVLLMILSRGRCTLHLLRFLLLA